jgi:serine-type D-Ala-D-Ala carboxypeptidase
VLHDILADATGRVTPGGVLTYGDAGREVATIPFGRTHADPAGGGPVTAGTVYDVASLTKPIAATAALMKAVEAGEVELDEPISRLLPELGGPGAAAICLHHLAGHAAGLPAHVAFFERVWAGDLAGAATRREAIFRMAAGVARTHPPGERAVYSDVGYILLGLALERAAGRRLDEVVAERVFRPLAMAATRFVDLDADPPAVRPAPVAPTEVCPRRGLVCGEVHDENAHAGGGIFGHAGLFSTAGDVARFGRAMIAAATGARGVFDPTVVRACFGRSAAPGTSWRLGWDTPSGAPGVSHAGDRWPRDGLGHLAFTGCSLWLDPPRGRYAVLLTNRVHPTREGEGIRELRRAVMDAVVDALDGPPTLPSPRRAGGGDPWGP